MNELPPFHVCHTLTAENECMKGKYNQLKKKYKEMYREFLELKEQMVRIEIETEYSHLKKDLNNTQVRVKQMKAKKQEELTKKANEDESSIKRLVPLYDNLLKRYEAENKQTRQQVKRIKKLEVENEKLKEEIFKCEQGRDFFNKQLQDKEAILRNVSSANKNKRSSNYALENRINDLTKEKNALAKENEKLKDELKGLDESFFEEVEDMKYALQQSSKLNQEYEKALKHICKVTGMNYKRTLQKYTNHSSPDIPSTTSR